MHTTDVLIIGGGLAALMTALKLVEDKKVTIITKGVKESGNSWKAQGGIAAALNRNDSSDLHEMDTLQAGCYINNRKIVHILVQEGPERLHHWMRKGLSFDRDQTGKMIFGQEGAHTKRRIIHAGGDQTGKKTMEFFMNALNNRVELIENLTAVDLITDHNSCIGASFMNDKGEITTIYAQQTVLATGGIGGLFLETSNECDLVGDGIAMAYRAGANVRHLEYIQFHPTLIFSQGRTVGLASEALRGEGAVIVNQEGLPVMKGIHPLGDLAPRDIVARTLYKRIQEGERLYLDITPVDLFSRRFPQITALCKQGGIDWKNGRIPICPGAHFHMGGIETNEHGQTKVPGLFAVGEAACNGVHGANRLASNSLLEAIVFGERAGESILRNELHPNNFRSLKRLHSSYAHPMQLPLKEEIRQRVSDALGVVRNEQKLTGFITWLNKYGVCKWIDQTRSARNREDIETENMMITAYLTAQSALSNKQSCGAHYIEEVKGTNNDEQTFAETTVG
ncbi:L-aspartate oxidase [Salipaludibacillus keqinensis]|uniref:L-aspartate oxidase n=1 Tax=Salipaludibacillus keqinensis TaxID=2045207 RepID=A0A323THT5_9BACI|nr:L-aspartate oxidase [Salipaludibacillus keqinensis]PYZ94080.1 L-aspartate oxidase [Salipaludibacillus keqinensis]